MRNLQHEDTGSYWCGEEIGGIFQVDETEQLHLTVQSAPDVSVMNSSVSGHEGDNVSVQCFYTSGYQNKLKHWCRYKDKSCYTGKRTDTSLNPSVQIRDDGRSSFTVLMTGLRLSDSGWYFCSAGDLQASVQLTVTDPNVPVLTVIAPKPGNTDSYWHYGYLEAWIPVVVLLLLMVVVVVSIIILRKKRNRNNTHNTEVTRDGDSDAGNSVRSSSAVAENDVTYSSVTVRPKTKTKAFSPVSVEDEVTYSSVHKQQKKSSSNMVNGTLSQGFSIKGSHSERLVQVGYREMKVTSLGGIHEVPSSTRVHKGLQRVVMSPGNRDWNLQACDRSCGSKSRSRHSTPTFGRDCTFPESSGQASESDLAFHSRNSISPSSCGFVRFEKVGCLLAAKVPQDKGKSSASLVTCGLQWS
ncbi:unnamed protein product [Leuciscus chuanchicus]